MSAIFEPKIEETSQELSERDLLIQNLALQIPDANEKQLAQIADMYLETPDGEDLMVYIY